MFFSILSRASNSICVALIITSLEDAIGEVEELIEVGIPSKGDTEEDCQHLCVISAIRKLGRTVNGLEEKYIQFEAQYYENEKNNSLETQKENIVKDSFGVDNRDFDNK